METNENYFEKLAAIDCSEYVEKKGKFNYLSWTWAVKQLRKEDPTATWEVIRHNGMPYLKTECGFFVEVAVTCQGITLSQIHPVLNGANKPIPQPNAFDINTSIQRCLVKAIALHGLGLYIYAGEDLPEEVSETPAQTPNIENASRFRKLYGEIKTEWANVCAKNSNIKMNMLDAQCMKKYGKKSTELSEDEATDFLKILRGEKESA